MADRTPPRKGRGDQPDASRAPARGRRADEPRSSTPRSSAPRSSAPRSSPGRATSGRSAAGRTTSGTPGKGGAGPPPSRGAGIRANTSRTGPARSGTAGSDRSRPGKERPALAARPPRSRTPAPPSPSTAWVRGAILLGIVVMLAVTLVPTLRSVIQQRNDASALQDQVSQQQLTVQQLEKQAALWKDPAYIELQARQRLKFVRVGDRAYTVIDGTREPSQSAPAGAPLVSAPMANASSPWYGKLWQSIQIADRPTAGLAR